MASPRSHTVIPDTPGFYHCICRCVRRAWLCGDDPLTGVNFDHRRGWIERKALDLAEYFAVSVYGYAVMSNHMHLVVWVDPHQVASWSDEEVAERWSWLTRHIVPDESDAAQLEREARRNGALSCKQRIDELRHRLGDLSWFMRFLNETIARAANSEDGCTGRFWEGRFGCKALCDDTAVLGCMTYVDLNPIRAGIADNLADSHFTSVHQRCKQAKTEPHRLTCPLLPMAGLPSQSFPNINLGHYLELVDQSGRQAHPEKLGRIEGPIPRCLTTLRCHHTHWQRLVSEMEHWFGCAVGAADSLTDFADLTGRRWVKGVSSTW